MPERVEFQRELDILHKDLSKMGAIVEKTMVLMIDALITGDKTLADTVIQNDKTINRMELMIEKECILLIARQQPIATDLRDITAVLKIITDLERIADHCKDISKYVIKLSDQKHIKASALIPAMVDKVRLMVNSAIDSYIKKDFDLAKKVIELDDEVDRYFYKIIDELVEVMKENADLIRQCKDYMFIVKYLERMGDHATNIAEWVIFTISGIHKDFVE